MKTYATEDHAFHRQSFLATEFGVFSGVRRNGDCWELLYDPDLYNPDNARTRLKDIEAEYQEDSDGYAWLPMELSSVPAAVSHSGIPGFSGGCTPMVPTGASPAIRMTSPFPTHRLASHT